MPNKEKSILQPKNDVVFKALFSRGKPRITQAMLEDRSIEKVISIWKR